MAGTCASDISYTQAPSWIKLTSDPNDVYSSFWSLARLSFPEARSQYIGHPDPSPQHQALLEPDDHLLCFDYLFYTGVSLRVSGPPILGAFPANAAASGTTLPSPHKSSSATTRPSGSSSDVICAGPRALSRSPTSISDKRLTFRQTPKSLR